MTLFRLNFNGLLRITNFSHENFYLGFSLLQMIIVLHPSRIRHNGDTGADAQQGPVQRFLFRLRPCVNLFYCLLLLHTLRTVKTTERDTGVISKLFRHARLMHVPGNSGLIIEGTNQPNICCKVRIPLGVFGVASLALYASAPNHVFGQ